MAKMYPSGSIVIDFLTGQLPPAPGFTITVYTPGVKTLMD